MDTNPPELNQDEPSCSHGPVTIKSKNDDDTFLPKEMITCVLKPQVEAIVSKEIFFHHHENVTRLEETDELLNNKIAEQNPAFNNNDSNTSKEVAIHEPKTESASLKTDDENDTIAAKIGVPSLQLQNDSDSDSKVKTTPKHPHIPLLLISRPPSLVTDKKPTVDPVTTQPNRMSIPMLPTDPKIPDLNTESLFSDATSPPSLFLQALSKINQSTLSVNLLQQLQDIMKNSYDIRNRNLLATDMDISAPSSITESAPPSYSFVLRQNSRRPQLMGTFFPSPSFIPLTPPPNYAAAFDIYMDNSTPPPRPRAINYGFTPMPVVCPICGVAGISVTHCKITLCTHLCAVMMCFFCCWLCAPLPYLLSSCKDVYHYCSNCRNYLGMYCPTNPDASSPTFV